MNTDTSDTFSNLEISQKKEICLTSFIEVAEFYNSNEEAFKSFEKDFGINVWFLNHFRTYMNYRNKKLLNNESSKTKVSKLNLLFRICREILFILIKYKPFKRHKSKYLIISNYSDQINGKNSRFGELELEFDSLHNRQLLDIKESIRINEFSTYGRTSSDSIFLSYLLRFSFVNDLFIFHNHLKSLKHQVTNSDLSNNESKINTIFWKNTALFYICYLRFKSFEFFFKKSKYKGILLSDENSPQQKVIQYAAKINDIEIFAFQHGNIHELHPAYIYGFYNNIPKLPDLTFCWGNFFSELLKNKGGYNNSNLRVVGRIPFNSNSKRLNTRLKKINNILLYASQPQRDENLRHKLLKDIMICCKILEKKYTLVIRPHPNEKTDVFFNNVAQEVEYFDFIIDRKSDLESHFKVCKLFIVAFSTVGTEFIPHYKPMLVLDYYNQDLVGFIKNGVGIPIRKQSDLLKELSKNELKINQLAYQTFIAKYYDTGKHIIEKNKKSIYEY